MTGPGDLASEANDQITLWSPHELDKITTLKWCMFCQMFVNRRTNAGHYAACMTLNPHDPS